MPPFIDHTGVIYGRLYVKYRVENKGKHVCWFCECSCGGTVIVSSSNLVSKHTQSCGCFQIERTVSTQTTHGMRFTVEYNIYYGMKGRCYNKNDHKYPIYGGRGIIICKRWLESFENFYNDMGNRPSKKHSIDRIDNDGNYTPDNCKWSTQSEQQSNKQITRWFYARSPIGRWYKSKNQSAFAREHGLFQSGINFVLLKKRKHHHSWFFVYV